MTTTLIPKKFSNKNQYASIDHIYAGDDRVKERVR